MGPTFRAVAYWTALIVSAVFFLAISLAIVATFIDVKAHAHLWSDERVKAAILAYGALFLSAVAALSGVFFGWRKDRREAKDLELKTKELEIKLRELESRLNGRLPQSN
jgi:uncharacterized membrane protein YbhN (UPF0104 family)